MKLKVRLKGDKQGQEIDKPYHTEVNSSNYKEIALVLVDLNNIGLPIEKAIREFNLSKSDWNAALRI